MGAESSSLQDFKIDDSVTQTADKAWTLHSAKDVDGSRVSVFVYETSVKQSSGFMENAAKQLKLLRHPCILRFLSWKKTSTGGLLVTEPIKPLESVVDSLAGIEICAGLYNIIDAVSFLHEKGGISHNNISLSSIFVAEDGTWKLGGMECVCAFDQTTPTFLKSCATLRDKQSIPPEEKGSISLISKEHKHARDAYAVGVLCRHLLTFLQELGIPTSTFEARVDDFISSDPKKRPKVNSLLEDNVFRNEFLEIINFLRQITLKNEEEKKVFFEAIVEKLYALPQEVVAARLARPLLSRFVLLDSTAVEELIPHLLMPCKERGTYEEGGDNPIFSEDLFRIHMIPELFKIFHVRDAHVRMTILQHFHAYMHLFDRRALRAIILPQILLGVKDLNDSLVAGSLHALAYLVPVLGGDVVVGGSRGKIFSEGKPLFSGKKQANGNVEMRKKIYPMKNGETLLSQAKFVERQTTRTNPEEKRKIDRQRREEDRYKKREESARSPSKETSSAAEGSSPVNSESRFGGDGIDADNFKDVEIENEDGWSGWDKEESNDFEDLNGDTEDISEGHNLEDIGDNYSNTVMMNSVTETDKLKGTKNPLKLTKPKRERTKSSEGNQLDTNKTETINSELSWGTDWNEKDSLTNSSAPGAEMQGGKSASAQSNQGHSKPPVVLGEEFDIMALDVKVSKTKSAEIDFFAEMEPEIKSSGMNLLEALSGGSSQPPGGSTSNMPTSLTDLESAKFSTVSRLNFAVPSDAKDESGWGDEAWDEDFPDLDES